MATGRRRGRAIIILAFILILILALVLVFARFNPLGGGGGTVNSTGNPAVQPTPTQAEVVNIIVTTQDVRRGQELSEDLLALVAIPRADYTAGVFFTDKKELAGSKAKYDLKAHTPLTTALVIKSGATASLPAFEIPTGKVAIAIPVSKLSSVAYGLQKGDHVNVIVSLLLVDLDTGYQSRLPNRTGAVIAPGPAGQAQTNVTALLSMSPEYTASGGGANAFLGRIEIDPTLNEPVYTVPSEPQRPRMVSQTMIQDAVILQMGDFEISSQTGTTAAANPETATQPTAQPVQQGQATPTAPVVKVPTSVTLIVEPQDAVSLNYMMLAGANLNLVMRAAGDNEAKDTESVTLQFILDQYRITNPAKLPYGMEPRRNEFPSQLNAFPEAPTLAPAP